MSIETSQSESPDHDELVAYLDGELAAAECRAVEERLAKDPEFRQQLRDLDQAWEALNALPTTSVDDGFARTTIELACVAAEEDLTKRTQALTVERRGNKWRWVACCALAAVLGFSMIRSAAMRREHALLSDLPVIGQADVLDQAHDVDFLRKLAAAMPAERLTNDKAAYDRAVDDYAHATAPSLDDRRAWVQNLTPEQKSDLAERSYAYEHLRRNPQEKERLRRMANEINRSPELQRTLVAYGQFLSRRNAGEKEQMREDAQKQTVDERVASIKRMVQRDEEQAARRLPAGDVAKLRREILQLVKEKKPELVDRMPQGPIRKRFAEMDVSNLNESNAGPVLYILREALQDDASGEESVNRLLNSLSDDAKRHWDNLPRWPRDRRRNQLTEWLHEASQPKWGPQDLEQFFLSDKLSPDDRQKLLDMPRAKMEAELERLYLKSELRIEFSEALRGQRGGRFGDRPPEGGRPGENWRGDGPPPRGDRLGPDRRPGDRFDRERPPGPGPDGPRGTRPENGPPGRPRGPAGDGFPPDGPPRDQPPTPPDGKQPT
jgi:hypothetical protein